MTRSVVAEPQGLSPLEVPKPNLTDEEIRYAVKKLHREPNEVEWAMLEAQWSEHCSYKSSKPLLKQLPSKGPRVLLGPGFDAGVIDIGDGWVVTLHIESHNHPSAIDPYGGAATGVGGVVRDILSLGTRPIALLDPLRFGSIESLHTRWLFDNVIRGISDYGNCVSGKDLVYFTNDDDFHISDFESFFYEYQNNGKCSLEFSNNHTVILKPKIELQVLSFDFKSKRATFHKVNRIYRMLAPKLLSVHTNLGRVVSVTPEHPMFVASNDGIITVKQASDIRIGDRIPILCDYPTRDELRNTHEIDVIKELTDRGQGAQLGIRPAKRFPRSARSRFKRHENFASVKVKKVEEVNGEFPVYNLEVDGTHNYVTTGGIITHNCIGVPTVGGEVEFDLSFERNCLVDVACIGLGRKDRLVLGEARNPGDLVYLVGGRTGRDGIRGASFASKTLTDKSDMERSAVQVPDPFTKKLIIEAILEAVEANIVQGMKDLGGGGLSCGLSEIAAKAGTGIEIDLNKIQTREPNMQPAEIMISESQERMVLLIREKDERRLVNILEKWEVGYAKIGHVTNGLLLTIRRGDEVVAKVPAKFVAEAPLSPRSSKRPLYLDALAEVPEPTIPKDLGRTLVELLSNPSIASKEWIYRQYDHEVGIRTIVKPGEADSALLRLPNKRSLALTTGGNSKQCYVDPYWGTVGVVSEALCNLVAGGAEPVAVVDHLQFGDPGNPEVYWTFKEAIRALSNYLKALGVPCVGGKVSFYNEDSMNRKAIKSSPVIAALGLVEPKTPKILQALREEGDDLIIVGSTTDDLGGSEYYEHIHKLTSGQVSRVNLKKEKILLRSLLRILRSGHVESAHDISKGGLAVALAEMSVQGHKGVTIDLDQVPDKTSRIDNLLFSESRSRFVLETKPKNGARIIGSFKRLGIPAARVGSVTDNGIEFLSNGQPIITIPLAEASRAWSETIPRAMEATL
jgi:phosphoribosylformylglycinamidine synthase subunit PurL